MKKEDIKKTIEDKIETMKKCGYTGNEINCHINGLLQGLVIAEVLTIEEGLEILEGCDY